MTIPPDIRDFSRKEIIDTLDEVRHPFEVAVYSSENYFNFGTIVRTAHSFLARKLWMIDFDRFYRKSAMGTHKWEDVEDVTLASFIERNQNRNIVVFERSPELEMEDLRLFSYPDEPIMVFGAEKWGTPDDILDVAHSIVSIPVFGIHNDMNVSVAAGIAMFDFINKFYQNNV